jgi:hypothetical protein
MASSNLMIRDPRPLAVVIVRPLSDGLPPSAAFLAGRAVRRGLRIAWFLFALPGTVLRFLRKLLRLARILAIAGLAGIAILVLIAGTQAPSATHQVVSNLGPNEARGGAAVHALLLRDVDGRSLPAANVGSVAISPPPTLPHQNLLSHGSLVGLPNPFAESNFSSTVISPVPSATVGRTTYAAPGISPVGERLETPLAASHTVPFPPPSPSYTANRSSRIRIRL